MNSAQAKKMLNKVPEVTAFFWIIKILCTTVGETAADYLNETLGFGLTGTSIVMSALLVGVLLFQFKAKKYIPSTYWLAVVLLSIVGTLITDNLTDNMGVSLETTTIVFSIVLALVFALWFAVEKTLSIHSIVTSRRESFYWLAILFTFALGTAAGDLSAEKLDLGYLTSLFIFAALIVVVTISHFIAKGVLAAEHRLQSTNAVLAFWLAYILTRPLGASIGDYLSQSRADGALNLGATATSAIFLITIMGLVVYLTLTRKDETPSEVVQADLEQQCALEGCKNAVGKNAHLPYCSEICVELDQGNLKMKKLRMLKIFAVCIAAFTLVGVAAYYAADGTGKKQEKTTASAVLGDLSSFKKIAEDTLELVNKKKMTEAKSKIKDLETAWDNAEEKMKPKSPEEWNSIDKAIDRVLTRVRNSQPVPEDCASALSILMAKCDSMSLKTEQGTK